MELISRTVKNPHLEKIADSTCSQVDKFSLASFPFSKNGLRMHFEHFDGPYFDPELIGPNGKLKQLHKGGKIAANRAAQQRQKAQQKAAKNAAKAQARQAAAARKAQERAAAHAEGQAAAASAAALAEQKRNNAALEQLSAAEGGPTEYIDDRKKKRNSSGRSAFGLKQTRAGLGGRSSTLG